MPSSYHKSARRFPEKILEEIRTGFRGVRSLTVNHRKYVIGGALGVIVVAVIAGLFLGGFISTGFKQEVSTDDPIDIVLYFYGPWLAAAQSTSTDPYQLKLAEAPILSKALRKRLLTRQDGIDPVLCQTTVPLAISALRVYETADTTEILVMSREKGALEQAIITLRKHNGGWYIDDILCSPGEFASQEESTFERGGYLLKDVKPPFDPQYWHLVFEENNEQGHMAPLFFDAESICIDSKKHESVCSTDQFKERLRVSISGDMTELGVHVKRLQLVR